MAGKKEEKQHAGNEAKIMNENASMGGWMSTCNLMSLIKKKFFSQENNKIDIST